MRPRHLWSTYVVSSVNNHVRGFPSILLVFSESVWNTCNESDLVKGTGVVPLQYFSLFTRCNCIPQDKVWQHLQSFQLQPSSVWCNLQMVLETNGNSNRIPHTGGPSSILCQSLVNDVIPDRGQAVTSTVSVQWRIQGSDVNSLLHSPFEPFMLNW